MIAILHAPLLSLSGRLARCRFRALLDFGSLIRAHDRAFDEKWVKPGGQAKESLLGSPDVSSLADISHGFEEIDRMRLIPFDRKAAIVLIAAALIPDDSASRYRLSAASDLRHAYGAYVLREVIHGSAIVL